MKILIVDDELLIRNVIKEYASFEGYEVFEAEDGFKTIEIVENNDIDLIILDIMMPKLDGFGTCREIKKIKNIPIIMLSARTDEYDKLFGFEMGIDDYITKPFSPKELIARIKAVLKRNNLNEEDNFNYKGLVIDYKGHSLYIDDKEIKLTPKEYELLCYFVKNNKIALSREQLLSKIWGYDFFGDARTIDTHIKMLRNNLGEYRDLISTVRGMGYKFEIKEK
ncbi:MAG: response regulator transcription factor [Bacilli bacterium]|nr:response regulator transcription factor [Bacilli bacterium]